MFGLGFDPQHHGEKQGCGVSKSQQSAWPSQTSGTYCRVNAHKVLSVGLNQIVFESLAIRYDSSKGVKGLEGA